MGTFFKKLMEEYDAQRKVEEELEDEARIRRDRHIRYERDIDSEDTVNEVLCIDNDSEVTVDELITLIRSELKNEYTAR